MAQEENNDVGGTFSTLNINAMEFVPSFGFRPSPRSAAVPTLEDETNGSAETLPSPPAAAEEPIVADTTETNSPASNTPTTPPDQTAQLPIPTNNIHQETLSSFIEPSSTGLAPTNLETPNPLLIATESDEPVVVDLDTDQTYASMASNAVLLDILTDNTPDNAGKSMNSYFSEF